MGKNVSHEDLIVEGKYFVASDVGEDKLKELKSVIGELLDIEGYIPVGNAVHIDMPELNNPRRSMTFRVDYEESIASTKKIMTLLGLGPDQGLDQQKFFKSLRRMRGDVPFQVEFLFRTVATEDREGYEVDIKSTPAILQKKKHKLIESVPSEEIDHATSTGKRFVNRIMRGIEAEALLEPQTIAKVTESSLDAEMRAMFEKLKYGNKVIMHVDEGHSCVKNDLFHSALNSYVHAIEWAIICYLENEEDKDIIEEEKEQDENYTFHELVKELEGSINLSQKTENKLENMNSAERRWIAHHKTGRIAPSDVSNVKERFEILVDELF